jgi:hypothetical protein
MNGNGFCVKCLGDREENSRFCKKCGADRSLAFFTAVDFSGINARLKQQLRTFILTEEVRRKLGHKSAADRAASRADSMVGAVGIACPACGFTAPACRCEAVPSHQRSVDPTTRPRGEVRAIVRRAAHDAARKAAAGTAEHHRPSSGVSFPGCELPVFLESKSRALPVLVAASFALLTVGTFLAVCMASSMPTPWA